MDEDRREQPGNTKLFVGNVGPNISEADLEDAFSKYGKLTNATVMVNPLVQSRLMI